MYDAFDRLLENIFAGYIDGTVDEGYELYLKLLESGVFDEDPDDENDYSEWDYVFEDDHDYDYSDEDFDFAIQRTQVRMDNIRNCQTSL